MSEYGTWEQWVARVNASNSIITGVNDGDETENTAWDNYHAEKAIELGWDAEESHGIGLPRVAKEIAAQKDVR